MIVTQSDQSSSPNDREQTERPKTSKPGVRLRLACDSCHDAKVRCSGSNPCLACQMYQTNCIYSPSSQPGRPKGSKNKRTPMQQSKSRQAKMRRDKSTSQTTSIQWSEADSKSVVSAEDTAGSPSVESLIDSISDTRLHMGLETDFNTFFSETSTEQLLSQPQYHTLPFATPESSERDSDQQILNRHQNLFPVGDRYPCVNTFVTHEPQYCSCLQEQAQLVYQLGDLQYFQTGAQGPTIDSTLKGVQSAQVPWRTLMECNRCQSRKDQKEALLLFGMSIRILLSSVQRLDVNSYDLAPTGQVSIASHVEVSVGSFELTGETKVEVMSVIRQKAIQSITPALIHLLERTSQVDSSNHVDSANNVFAGVSTGPPHALNQYPSPLISDMRADDIGSLLNVLQSAMQILEARSRDL